MKKSRLFATIASLGIALLGTTLTVTSCTEEMLNELMELLNGVTSMADSSVIGVWQLVSSHEGGYTHTPQESGVETVYDFTIGGAGKLTTFDYGSTYDNPVNAKNKYFNWKLENDNLYIDDVLTYTVKSVNTEKTKLVLAKYEKDFPGQWADFTYTFTNIGN